MTWDEQKQVLKSLGYNNYKEYVAGIRWADIRDKVFRTKGKKCIVCTRNATVIHHREYSKEVLEGTNITPLEPLCWDCHNTIEYDKRGNKIDLVAANNKLDWYLNNKHLWKKRQWSSMNLNVQLERRRT